MSGDAWKFDGVDSLPNRTCCLNLELLKIGRDSTALGIMCPEELLPQEACGETLIARTKHKGKVTTKLVIKRAELHEPARSPSFQGQLLSEALRTWLLLVR